MATLLSFPKAEEDWVEIGECDSKEEKKAGRSSWLYVKKGSSNKVSFSIPLPIATSSICLLDEDNEERLFLHKTGYKFLQSCPDNLCVTSIIGRAGGGKSTLHTLLTTYLDWKCGRTATSVMMKSNGSATSGGETHGVNVLNAPSYVRPKFALNKNVAQPLVPLVLCDTIGLGGMNESANRMMAGAILLSSAVVLVDHAGAGRASLEVFETLGKVARFLEERGVRPNQVPDLIFVYFGAEKNEPCDHFAVSCDEAEAKGFLPSSSHTTATTTTTTSSNASVVLTGSQFVHFTFTPNPADFRKPQKLAEARTLSDTIKRVFTRCHAVHFPLMNEEFAPYARQSAPAHFFWNAITANKQLRDALDALESLIAVPVSLHMSASASTSSSSSSTSATSSSSSSSASAMSVSAQFAHIECETKPSSAVMSGGGVVLPIDVYVRHVSNVIEAVNGATDFATTFEQTQQTQLKEELARLTLQFQVRLSGIAHGLPADTVAHARESLRSLPALRRDLAKEVCDHMRKAACAVADTPSEHYDSLPSPLRDLVRAACEPLCPSSTTSSSASASSSSCADEATSIVRAALERALVIHMKREIAHVTAQFQNELRTYATSRASYVTSTAEADAELNALPSVRSKLATHYGARLLDMACQLCELPFERYEDVPRALRALVKEASDRLATPRDIALDEATLILTSARELKAEADRQRDEQMKQALKKRLDTLVTQFQDEMREYACYRVSECDTVKQAQDEVTQLDTVHKTTLHTYAEQARVAACEVADVSLERYDSLPTALCALVYDACASMDEEDGAQQLLHAHLAKLQAEQARLVTDALERKDYVLMSSRNSPERCQGCGAQRLVDGKICHTKCPKAGTNSHGEGSWYVYLDHPRQRTPAGNDRVCCVKCGFVDEDKDFSMDVFCDECNALWSGGVGDLE